jgi:NAD(P)-dependent dehydrogenase (short-subunit alcohol dehydrogenase family)
MEEVRSRTALITGGSRGIGAAIARTYAAAGLRVVIGFRSDESRAWELVRSLKGEGHGVAKADVSDPSQVREMVDSAFKRLGRLDILVNNAGIFEDQPFTMEDYGAWQESWNRVLAANLLGAANAAYCAVARMIAQGGGKIINVASRAAFRGETEAPAYGASKAAMVNLTRSLARSLAKDNILSYCIAPGWVETAMARDSMDERLPEMLGEIPLGRIATVEDVAQVALFLASDSANYLTGITIPVTGGSWMST